MPLATWWLTDKMVAFKRISAIHYLLCLEMFRKCTPNMCFWFYIVSQICNQFSLLYFWNPPNTCWMMIFIDFSPWHYDHLYIRVKFFCVPNDNINRNVNKFHCLTLLIKIKIVTIFTKEVLPTNEISQFCPL